MHAINLKFAKPINVLRLTECKVAWQSFYSSAGNYLLENNLPIVSIECDIIN